MKDFIRIALVLFLFSLLPLHALHAADMIRWQAPEKIKPLDIFKDERAEDSTWIKEESVFQRVGTITNGQYAGSALIIAYVTTGLFVDYTYHIVKKDEQITLLKKYSADPANDDYPFDSAKVHIDLSYAIPALDFPKTLQGVKSRQLLEGGVGSNSQFSTKGLKKVFTHKTYGAVYANEKGFLLIKSPDGQAISYEFVPDFSITSIRWAAGQKKIIKESDYTYESIGGCGGASSLNVVTLSPNKKELKQVGTNAKGDPIYFFKDSNNEYLKNIYEVTADQSGKKTSYKKFLNIRPTFFWIDPFGRLIEYRNSKLVSLAECGKPVIYLYPEKTQDVTVSLRPNGEFTKSEPAYGNGWVVRANPDGTLTDYRSGNQYPYLFWEGRGTAQTTYSRNEGFVVPRDNVHSFLETSLAKLGLNEKERRDFEEFWEPRMVGAPYYQVTFYGNRLMDQIAPLFITPQPDTVIRILMDYAPLTEPFSLPEQKLVSPSRKGFTVIEWGGVLR